MHKIFNLLRAWLQLPDLIAPCDPLAQMSLRDLADLPRPCASRPGSSDRLDDKGQRHV